MSRRPDTAMGAVTSYAWPVLRDALRGRAAPLPFMVRDDDAGWADERLFALLDAMRAADAPIDLAVIPRAVGVDLAAALCDRVDAARGRVGLHQHGYAHVNHEPNGRKGEFGDARSLAARVADVRAGREALLQAFAHRVDAIFTPPWNRCAPDLPAQLATLGFAALSRDATAPGQAALPELPVQVDWCRHWREVEGDAQAALPALDAALAHAAVSGTASVGLMLHHAVMGDDELRLLRQLMAGLRSDRQVRCVLMRELLPQAAPAD